MYIYIGLATIYIYIYRYSTKGKYQVCTAVVKCAHTIPDGNGNEMVLRGGKVRVAESPRGSRKGEVEYFRVVAFWKRILQQRSNPNLHGNLCHLEA